MVGRGLGGAVGGVVLGVGLDRTTTVGGDVVGERIAGRDVVVVDAGGRECVFRGTVGGTFVGTT